MQNFAARSNAAPRVGAIGPVFPFQPDADLALQCTAHLSGQRGGMAAAARCLSDRLAKGGGSYCLSSCLSRAGILGTDESLQCERERERMSYSTSIKHQAERGRRLPIKKGVSHIISHRRCTIHSGWNLDTTLLQARMSNQ